MGSAVIVDGGPDGLYTIERDFSLPGQAAELARLAAEKTALAGKISVAEKALASRQQEVTEAIATLQAMVQNWQDRLAAGLDPDPLIDPSETDPDPAADPGAFLLDPQLSGATSACLTAHNTIRTDHGRGALASQAALDSAAQFHADWLAENDQGGHSGANNSSPDQRMLAAGYPFGPGGIMGENVAAGQGTIAAVMEGWMNSPAHRANILLAEYTQIGVGYSYRSLGTYRHYWCVCFGRPAS